MPIVKFEFYGEAGAYVQECHIDEFLRRCCSHKDDYDNRDNTQVIAENTLQTLGNLITFLSERHLITAADLEKIVPKGKYSSILSISDKYSWEQD